MPRAAAPNSCNTCRTRKVKCDGALPRCQRCEKHGWFCDRSRSLTVKQYQATAIISYAVEDSPRALLQHDELAHLFQIYIKELAPWYDLNDSSSCSFATLVPAAALDTPLLFSAIIAFAGTYAIRKYKVSSATSETFHSRCLHLLISLSPEDEKVKNGVALAATCLLRSYEILSEREDPNRHLFGASTLVPPQPSLVRRGLLAGGFWNYLREDITYSLIHECPLKVQVGLPVEKPGTDDDFANSITLLLAALVNAYFGHNSIDMFAKVQVWRDNFPFTPFSRIEKEPFPTIRMLKDCQVAAMHYYHVALCMLKPELRVTSAIEICGLAMGSTSDAVTVNAYGPITFAGRWLTDGQQRQTLISWLRNTQKNTAWSVEVLVAKLNKSWEEIETLSG